MSRYTGPRLRVLRALGADLPGLTRKGSKRRETRPGQHGNSGRRRRPSEYALQLREKQMVRFNYGLTERQLQHVYQRAKAMRGITGDTMLALLERRLDNAVFRAGFAPTIPAARQLVRHGHIRVRGRVVDIPSAAVREGDQIGLKPRSQTHPLVAETWSAPSLTVPEWLARSDDAKTATVVELPRSANCPLDVDMQLVVEFYAR